MTPCPVCGAPNFDIPDWLDADIHAYSGRRVHILFCEECGYWQPCSTNGRVPKVLKLR